MSTATSKTTTYFNLIDGAWVSSSSGDAFENRNPANTDDVVGVFQRSTAADVADAIDAARLAYDRWRLVPAPRRAELLFRAAQLIAERKEALARDMTREMGKVLDETRGDVQEAIDMTFFMAGEGRRQYGQTVPSELRDKFAMSVRQPMGVAAIITPWNFPMAIPSWKKPFAYIAPDGRRPPHINRAPSLRPISTYCITVSSCPWLTNGPICVFGSSPSPTVSPFARATNCSRNAS